MFVLPFALGAGVGAAASRRSDRRLALVSRQFGGEPVLLDIDALEPGSVTGWAAYPAGVAWALREAGYLPGGADLAIDADLPAGAGLSSSAALECSVALALTELYQVPVPRRELAALARRAENEFAGVPTGIMDQLAALLGRAGHALLLDCRTGTDRGGPARPGRGRPGAAGHRHPRPARAGRRPVRRPPPGLRGGRGPLGVRSLRDVVGDPGAPARLADPALRSVCEHVIAENGRVLRAAGLLPGRRPGGGGRSADRVAPFAPLPVPDVLAAGRCGRRGRDRPRRPRCPHDRRRVRRLGRGPRARRS